MKMCVYFSDSRFAGMLDTILFHEYLSYQELFTTTFVGFSICGALIALTVFGLHKTFSTTLPQEAWFVEDGQVKHKFDREPGWVSRLFWACLIVWHIIMAVVIPLCGFLPLNFGLLLLPYFMPYIFVFCSPMRDDGFHSVLRWIACTHVAWAIAQLAVWNIVQGYYQLFLLFPAAIAFFFLQEPKLQCRRFIIVLLVLATMSFFSGTCISFFAEGTRGAVNFFGLISVSTSFTRHMMASACGSDKFTPCHVYLTLAEDYSKEVFVNAHFPFELTSVVVHACDKSSDTCVTAPARPYENSHRWVYSALVSNLHANKVYNYTIEVVDKDDEHATNITASDYWFRTTGPSKPVRVAIGGNLGANDDVERLLRLAAPDSLDAVIIGGNVAFDNGLPQCYCVWDAVLSRYEGVARHVPLAVAVGNHDAGLNAFQYLTVNRELPFFAFMPMHKQPDVLGKVESQVPSLKHRRTYHAHKIGALHMLMLDTGYVETPAQQLTWMQNITDTQRASSEKMLHVPAYHNPMYPSIGSWGDARGPQRLRSRWVASGFFPDHFPFAFEHHLDTFKKTLALNKNDQVAREGENGTVYFGDGKWGAHGPGSTCRKSQLDTTNPRMPMVGSEQHIWILEVHSNLSASAVALTFGGKIKNSRVRLGPGGVPIATRRVMRRAEIPLLMSDAKSHPMTKLIA
eukprot:GEMP01005344.1.p1 GENE.GEMP01005344.1~~GEMP01005344.1.p1  ORF type:complete len:683 (+),score=113.16 GEMP01005344.1:47-2095(+)